MGGRGRDHCMSKEDKEDKEGIPIPPSKPKIWSMAELAVCKTPPLGSSLAAASSLVGGSGGGASSWQQTGGFGGLVDTGCLMRQNPVAMAAALRSTSQMFGMNLMGGASAAAATSSTAAADLSMTLYPEMAAAADHEEDPTSQTSSFADLRAGASPPPPHTPPHSGKMGGHHHHHHHHNHHHHPQHLSAISNNNNSSSSPHVIAHSHGLQQFQAYTQSHHYSTTSEMPEMMAQGGSGYMMDRLKMASSLASGLYEEDERASKDPQQHGYEGSSSGGKMAGSYEGSMAAMLASSCYSDRL